MRRLLFLFITIGLLSPAVLCAGQIYGTVTSGGRAVAKKNISITCGKAQPLPGITLADGSFRINVSQQGQCILTLPDYPHNPSIAVFSNPYPALFNLDLIR